MGTPMRRLSPILLLWLFACKGDDLPANPSSHGDSLDSARSDTGPPRPNVVARDDLKALWDCPEPYNDCVADYLAFPKLAAKWARPITEEALLAQLDALARGQVQQETRDMAEAEVEAEVRDALNMEFLLDDLDKRELLATTVRRGYRDGYLEENLLLEDPWVGAFQVILLLPEGIGAPVPVVMPLHGHGQRAESTLDFMHGREYPASGYGVLSVTFRVSAANASEDQVTRALLMSGFSFETIRLYETLLAIKYLRWRTDVDPNRIAVVGHSGSSLAMNLGLRLHPPIVGFVSDFTSCYYDAPSGLLVDDTVPALYPYAPSINDLAHVAAPVLPVAYGYEKDFPAILDFLAQVFQR